MSRLRSFIAVLLLIAFGVPSIAGNGLHLFLGHSCGCREVCASCECCAVESESETERSADADSLTEFQETHNEATCFLCQYFSAPADSSADEVGLTGETLVHRSAAACALALSDAPSSLYSGRSPPVLI